MALLHYFFASRHPYAHDIARYIAGQLKDAAELDSIEAHLLTCSCCQMLAGSFLLQTIVARRSDAK